MTRISTPFLGLSAAAVFAGAVAAQEAPVRVGVASLLREAGCSTTIDQLLTNQTIAPDQLQSALNELLSLGFAEITADGGLALTPAVCGLPNAPGVEVLTQAMRLNGCSMAESAAEALLSPFGLNRTNTTDFVETLVASGAGALSDGSSGFVLSPAACAGAEVAAAAPMPVEDPPATGAASTGALAPSAPRDRFVQMMADNGCTITENEFEAVRFSYSLTEDDAEAVAEGLIDAGQAMVMGEVFILDRSVCDTATAGAPKPATSPRDVFVAAIRANGCAMTQDEARAQEATIGLSFGEMDELADLLMDANEASVIGQALVLSPALCGDAAPAAEAAASVVAAPDITVETRNALGLVAGLESFVAAVHAGGCRMGADNARAYMAATGATQEQVQAIGETLIALNLAEEQADALVLAEFYCAAYRP